MLPRPRLRPQGLRKLFKPNRAPTRTLIAAPKPGSGPLMERRSDRALPSISASYRWVRTVPIFAAVMAASVLAIFNYQKQSSSVVSSTLYALRTNAQAREVLGDEIYFAHQIPWISGEINQLHGRIDISFSVKGTKGRGVMRFKSLRKGRMGSFETLEWSLEPEGGQRISMLETESQDPFQQVAADPSAAAA